MADVNTVIIEAYGARISVSAPDRALLDRIVSDLPEGWEPRAAGRDAGSVKWQFALIHEEASGYLVRQGNGFETRCGGEADVAIALLNTQIRRFIGHHARDLIFVHAGVVAHDGRAIVIPGHSFSGKSTLVAALVRAGAVYYSDEYAVIDENGLVTPYREPIAMRDALGRPDLGVTLETLGGSRGEDPIPIGLVVLTTYSPGSNWSPERLSTARGLLALLEHAIPARDRPKQTLAVLRRALEGAAILTGPRGESRVTAEAILTTRSE
jgi:hypothetical protein